MGNSADFLEKVLSTFLLW